MASTEVQDRKDTAKSGGYGRIFAGGAIGVVGMTIIFGAIDLVTGALHF